MNSPSKAEVVKIQIRFGAFRPTHERADIRSPVEIFQVADFHATISPHATVFHFCGGFKVATKFLAVLLFCHPPYHLQTGLKIFQGSVHIPVVKILYVFDHTVQFRALFAGGFEGFGVVFHPV